MLRKNSGYRAPPTRGGAGRLIGESIRIGAGGWLGGLAAVWLLIALLPSAAGAAGLAARVVGSGPREAVAALAALLGVPVDWQVMGFAGTAQPADAVAGRPWLAIAAVLPLVIAAMVGWYVARTAVRRELPVVALLAGTAAVFGPVGALLVLAAGRIGPDSLVTLSVSPLWTALLGTAWVLAGGAAGIVLYRMIGAPARPRRRWAPVVVAAVLAVPLSPLAGSALAEDTCSRFSQRCQETGICAAANALRDPNPGLDPYGPSANLVVDSLYRFQDYAYSGASRPLARYADRYWQHTRRVVALMQADQALLRQAARTLQSWHPAFLSVGRPTGNTVVVTRTMIDDLNALADAFVAADLATSGGGALAQTMQSERSRVDLDRWVGLTVNQAVTVLNAQAP